MLILLGENKTKVYIEVMSVMTKASESAEWDEIHPLFINVGYILIPQSTPFDFLVHMLIL